MIYGSSAFSGRLQFSGYDKNIQREGKAMYQIEKFNDGIFRLRGSVCRDEKESLYTKYRILQAPENAPTAPLYSETSGEVNGNSAVFKFDKESLTVDIEERKEGYTLSIAISDDLRIFGLGDVNRDCLNRRGSKAQIWVKNVIAYGPIPFIVTSGGWGFFVNSTFNINCDFDSEGKGFITFDVKKGTPDFFVFLSPTMKGIINLYTDVSGKPTVLPKSGYGMTFVSNEAETGRDVLEDTMRFRQEGILCDIIGLEPNWMSRHYDFTTNKEWNAEKFFFPYWREKDYYGSWVFTYNMAKFGMKLSLWLCCDYDLLFEEEKQKRILEDADYDGAEIVDEHFSYPVIQDKITVNGEPWFEHLKKFVKNGASAFKLDGSKQVLEHPDKLWAGQYLDEEVHNIYPVIYAKQMKNGYTETTEGNRAMVYSAGGGAGVQKYVCTWAGDTGGGPKTLTSILNYAMCGHTNASCDCDIDNLASTHYGFLLTWTQILAWRSWMHPWYLGEKVLKETREYGQLRSSLFPYIYSFAHHAAKTGVPVVRPLPLEFEDTAKFDNATNMYMLGSSLLVGAFDMKLSLPDGEWTDYFTEDLYTGDFEYICPEGKGGALMVRPGAIIVTQDPVRYIEEKIPEQYYVDLYKGGSSEFTLIEDDGLTEKYLSGEYCSTLMTLCDKAGEMRFTLDTRRGDYENKAPLASFKVRIHNIDKVLSLTCENESADFVYNAEKRLVEFTVSAEAHGRSALTYVLKY